MTTEEALNAISDLQRFITAIDGVPSDLWMLQDWLDKYAGETGALISQDTNVVRNVLAVLDHLRILLAEKEVQITRWSTSYNELQRTTSGEIM